MKEETWPVSALRPHTHNYNAHPAAQVERIAASLKAFGQPKRIVIRSDGTILAGHGVWQGAMAAGWDKVNVAIVPDDWTDERAVAFLVADNETRRGAEPDDEALAELVELARQEVDLSALGFDDTGLQALLDSITPEIPEPGDGGDEFEPEQTESRVKAGDVWVIDGKHRLICGDCTDPAVVARLMDGERADAVVTDPPYGVSYADKNTFLNAFDKGNRVQTPIENDHNDVETTAKELWEPAFHTLADAMKDGAVFYVFSPQGGDQMMMMMMMKAVLPVKHELMWLKNNHVLGRADYAYKHEPILYGWKLGAGHKYYGGFQTSVLEFDRPNKSDLHPTTKPLDLVSHLMGNSSLPGELIIDWFLGSGTTIIAAHRTNRRCYGCEISEQYCEIILQRCEAEGLSVERVGECVSPA